MIKNKCLICEKKVNHKHVITRSEKKRKIFQCTHCDFEFFQNNQIKNITNNRLDNFRLKNAGLNLIKKNEDFINGTLQSKEYVNNHLKTKRKLKILEIGCSWGYFLNESKKAGHNVIGLEINKIRKKFVKNKLKIDCYETLNEIKEHKFDKIFLFYSLEYINEPFKYLKNLIDFLKFHGEIIIYTPNKNDHINSILNLDYYKKFFYEENSINYFSEKSLKNVSKKLRCNYNLKLVQGYSLINFLNWYFHQKPFSTGFVGKDYYIDNLITEILKKKKQKKFVESLIRFIKEIDKKFKNLIIKNKISNILVLIIKK